MALSTEITKDVYTSSDYEFYTSFRITVSSDLIVSVIHNTSLVETELTISTDYTISTTYQQGSTVLVTLLDAGQSWLTGGNLSSDYTLILRRELPLTQDTSIRNQGSYYPELHENQFDKLVMLDQQQQEQLERCFKMSVSQDNTTLDPQLPSSYIGADRPILMLNDTGVAFADPPVTYTDLLSAIDTAGGVYTASRAMVTSGAGVATASGVTTTELGYVSGVTSAIQTQFTGKQSKSMLTTKGDLYVATASGVTARQAAGTDGYALVADSAQTNGIKYANVGVVKTISNVTSGTKTAGATNNYHQLTTNSITITAGTWELSGSATFFNSGGSPLYTDTGVGFYSANGADTSSTPTALSAAANLTMESSYPASNGSYLNASATFDAMYMPLQNVIVTVSASVTVYIVTYSSQTTSANTRITAYMTARRLY